MGRKRKMVSIKSSASFLQLVELLAAMFEDPRINGIVIISDSRTAENPADVGVLGLKNGETFEKGDLLDVTNAALATIEATIRQEEGIKPS